MASGTMSASNVALTGLRLSSRHADMFVAGIQTRQHSAEAQDAIFERLPTVVYQFRSVTFPKRHQESVGVVPRIRTPADGNQRLITFAAIPANCCPAL